MKTIFTNGRIYTADDAMPEAGIVVMENDKIIFVGDELPETLARSMQGSTAVYDLGGRTVLPGFTDGHTHPALCAASAWHVKLPWTENINKVLEYIKKYGEEHPVEEAPFLYFEYYPTCMFDENGPTKELLDSAISDRPVMCQDFGEHLHWFNSRMLECMEITKETPDPVPGMVMFERNSIGEPTGWGKEMVHLEYMDTLYKNIGWRPPVDMTPEVMLPFFDFLTDSGIMAMFDGMIETEDQIRSVFELDRTGMLNVYYDGSVCFERYAELPEKIETLREYSRKYTTKHIKINTMKLFLDGTNESGTSAMLSPHLNDPSSTNYGEIKMETDELAKCMLLCNKEGLDIHIHMVGDRAFRTGCDAVAAAKKNACAERIPWNSEIIFAHCEIIDPVDMPMAAELGITVNWSCHWSGGYFGEEGMNFFPEEKWRRMYQFNPVIESGALVTFSSDVCSNYERHRAAPLFGMQIAATRVDPEFPLDPEKYPGSMRPPASARINIKDLVKGYTINGARQLHLEKQTGSITKGKNANMLILSRDIFETAAEDISKIEIDAVIFEGKFVRDNSVQL